MRPFKKLSKIKSLKCLFIRIIIKYDKKNEFSLCSYIFLSRTQLQWTLSPCFSQILWESSTSVTQSSVGSADTGKCPMLIVEELGHSRGRIFISDFKHLLSELVNQNPVIIKDEKQSVLGWKTCHPKEEVQKRHMSPNVAVLFTLPDWKGSLGWLAQMQMSDLGVMNLSLGFLLSLLVNCRNNPSSDWKLWKQVL